MSSRGSNIHPPRTIRQPLLVPLARSSAGSSALPLPASSLVGRERELAFLTALLHDGAIRLLTLTGPGGVGKTRLALALAAEVSTAYADGVLFVPLAGVVDAELVPATIAAALTLRDSGERPLPEHIVAALRERNLLLVLDTFERLLPTAAFIADLVARCPRLTVLVTSRARLNLSGERIVRVAPLAVAGEAVTDPSQPIPAVTENAPMAPAVQLFVERATAVASEFEATNENAPVIADICRRLDGLPLAIELAAAWIRVLPPAALLERLERPLPLLAGGGVDLPPRLRSLRDAIAWSFDLLSPAEQSLFRRLAVFRGGFTLDAAADIGAEAGDEVLGLVRSLVDQSLLAGGAENAAADPPRFTMLDTIREFAIEQLSAHDETEALQARHAAWFLALAERAEPELLGPRQRLWLDRLNADIDNLRAALTWMLERGETNSALRLAGAAQFFWIKQGRYAEGRSWLARALAADAATTGESDRDRVAIRAKALIAAGSVAFIQGDYPAAIASHGAALTASREAGSVREEAHALNGLGGLLVFSGQFAEGRALLEQALPLYDERSDAFLHGMTLTQLGLALFQLGDSERALTLSQKAVEIHQAAGDWWGTALALSFHGSVALGAGDLPRAEAAFAASLTLAWQNGEILHIAEPIFGLGIAAGLGGHPVRAARLLGGAEALAEEMGFTSPTATPATLDRVAAEARASMGRAAYSAAWAAGRALSAADLVAEALGESAPTCEPMLHFTPRERAVLALLTEYKTDKEIGAALFISHRTAMWHVSQILRKLGVATRAEAAHLAIRHELV